MTLPSLRSIFYNPKMAGCVVNGVRVSNKELCACRTPTELKRMLGRKRYHRAYWTRGRKSRRWFIVAAISRATFPWWTAPAEKPHSHGELVTALRDLRARCQ